MLNSKRSWIILFVGVGLTLIAAGLSPLLLVNAQEATPEVAPEVTPEVTPEIAPEVTLEPLYVVSGEPVTVTGDNSYCLLCHNQILRVFPLPDGSYQELYVDPAMIAASVHGVSSETGTLGCVDCHGDDTFPHDSPPPASRREATIRAVTICASCHADQLEQLESGYHSLAVRAGNYESAVCTDCHGAHGVQSTEEHPELVALVCGDCHDNTLNEWQSSGHANIGDLGCSTCHSPHSQRIRVGETTTELCINCHDSADTDNFLVHQQHINRAETPLDCVSCHMDIEFAPAEAASSLTTIPVTTGHTMDVATVSCTTCHEELVASGDWTRLVSDSSETTAGETGESVTGAAANDEIAEAVRESETSGYVQLLQGLILGLGFGATVTAIFIARGNRDRGAARVHAASTASHAEPTPLDVESSADAESPALPSEDNESPKS